MHLLDIPLPTLPDITKTLSEGQRLYLEIMKMTARNINMMNTITDKMRRAIFSNIIVSPVDGVWES
jgi:hypothetical protein